MGDVDCSAVDVPAVAVRAYLGSCRLWPGRGMGDPVTPFRSILSLCLSCEAKLRYLLGP